ncbi:unnamed protein product [Arabidopsis halleri]
MPNLQLLRVGYKSDHPNIISSSGPLTFISPKLRLLDWSCFPMTSLRFINNLEFLVELSMRFSKLEKLWDGIKLLRNLKRMNLSYSENLKELPNLSMATSLEELNLMRCSSLVELPSSIGNLTNLPALVLTGCSSLVELPSSIGNLTNLQKLSLEGCSRLVSLPQLPDSLGLLEARNCESLEKLDCSFRNLGTHLNFVDCFKLNQEARDLLIQTSPVRLVVLPGKEVPACFTYRGYGNSVTVKLNQKPLRRPTKFKACILFKSRRVDLILLDTLFVYTKKNKDCILLDNKGEHEDGIQERIWVSKPFPVIMDRYIFKVEVEEVTSTELVFDFEIFDRFSRTKMAIKECGIIHLLEHHVDGDERYRMKMKSWIHRVLHTSIATQGRQRSHKRKSCFEAEGKSQGNKEEKIARSQHLMVTFCTTRKIQQTVSLHLRPKNQELTWRVLRPMPKVMVTKILAKDWDSIARKEKIEVSSIFQASEVI